MQNPKTPRKPGEGPAKIYLTGGRGREPRQDNACGDFWLHETIGSVHRLRIITWLCTHPGSHTAPQIAKALGVKYQAIQPHLIAMQYTMLADATWTPGYKTPTGGWVPNHRRWAASDAGRRYLWRFGWVTGRVIPGVWNHDTWFGEIRADPVQILADHATNHFTRPLHLALAHVLWQVGPVTPRRLQQALGIRRQILMTPLNLWRAAGWAQSSPVHPVRAAPPPSNFQRAAQWRFTPKGITALKTHCHALRWAAQHSGYIPPKDDRFLQERDRLGWNAIEWE